MPTTEKITLHAVPFSHPCMTVRAGMKLKGLEWEEVMWQSGPHADQIEEVYGTGRRTAPGILIGEEPVHGSVAILEELERRYPENPLYPEAIADAVSTAERWADLEFQDLGRSLSFGALRFRPEAIGTFAGVGNLDPAGTDFAMKSLYLAWKHMGLTAVQLADELTALPGIVARIDELAAQGVIDGATPTAADLQIGATARVLLTIQDLRPVLEGTAAERIAMRYFGDYPGVIPAGAFPAGWVKS